ncbi:MAG: hypothetical protein ABWK00_06110 [Desulfurococcaceae archaeon]
MASVEIVVHPTCATSYEVLKRLAAKGLLDRVEVTVADSPAMIRRGVWSVPWILVNGVPAATDPVTAEEVESIIRGASVSPPGDVAGAFMDAVLHSSYALSVVALWGSLEPAIDQGLVSAALRAPLTGANVAGALSLLREQASELYSKWEDAMARALGVSFVRDAWWASGGSLEPEALESIASPTAIGAWLLARASVGRVGLPPNPLGRGRRAAERISEFVVRGARGLLNRVRAEQGKILGDGDYWRLLEAVAGRPIK